MHVRGSYGEQRTAPSCLTSRNVEALFGKQAADNGISLRHVWQSDILLTTIDHRDEAAFQQVVANWDVTGYAPSDGLRVAFARHRLDVITWYARVSRFQDALTHAFNAGFVAPEGFVMPSTWYGSLEALRWTTRTANDVRVFVETTLAADPPTLVRFNIIDAIPSRNMDVIRQVYAYYCPGRSSDEEIFTTLVDLLPDAWPTFSQHTIQSIFMACLSLRQWEAAKWIMKKTHSSLHIVMSHAIRDCDWTPQELAHLVTLRTWPKCPPSSWNYPLRAAVCHGKTTIVRWLLDEAIPRDAPLEPLGWYVRMAHFSGRLDTRLALEACAHRWLQD